MRNKKWLPVFVISNIVLFNSISARAEDWNSFWQDSKISGNVRMYDFTRDFTKSGAASQNAFAVGGSLGILTAPIANFQFGATFYTSQSLSLNSTNSIHTDNTLPGFPVNVLGETYLQYKTSQVLVRAGNQVINTPWLNAADSRMIPATYQGVFASYSPIQTVTINGLRVFRFKSRTENDFSRTNLYNANNIGGATNTAYGNTPNIGALAMGVTTQTSDLKSNLWAYRFYDLSKLFYGDATYSFANSSGIIPQLGVQVLRETGDGSNQLEPYSAGAANATGYGIKPGITWNNFNASIAYDKILTRPGSFNNGNILSPYTAGYASDPLYTTSMIAGLIEKGSGQAAKIAMGYNFTKQINLMASYARYYTEPDFANTSEVDADATYNFDGQLKGFSIRDRIGMLNGIPSKGRFLYNRVMLQFVF